MIRRTMAALAVLGLAGAVLALGGPAQAQETPATPYVVYEADGCDLTLHLTSPAEWRDDDARTWPVFLVVDDGDQVDAVEVAPGTTGSAGPYDLTTTAVDYRVFGVAERDDDSPAWDIDRAGLLAYLADHGDEWLTGGTAVTPEWVPWHTAEVEGCERTPDPEATTAPTPEPTTAPEPTTEPTPEASAAPGAGGGEDLPLTSGPALAGGLAVAGLGLALAGVAGMVAGRRRQPRFASPLD